MLSVQISRVCQLMPAVLQLVVPVARPAAARQAVLLFSVIRVVHVAGHEAIEQEEAGAAGKPQGDSSSIHSLKG